jgi:hypothetical protein
MSWHAPDTPLVVQDRAKLFPDFAVDHHRRATRCRRGATAPTSPLSLSAGPSPSCCQASTPWDEEAAGEHLVIGRVTSTRHRSHHGGRRVRTLRVGARPHAALAALRRCGSVGHPSAVWATLGRLGLMVGSGQAEHANASWAARVFRPIGQS